MGRAFSFGAGFSIPEVGSAVGEGRFLRSAVPAAPAPVGMTSDPLWRCEPE